MDATVSMAILIPIFVSIFLSILSGKHWKEEEDKARARRLADARMNARLLRFNI
jgi:hypothetical protein